MLLFDHYPKAGGSSIRTWLCENYAPDDVFNLSAHVVGNTRQDFYGLPRHEQQRVRCLLSHSGAELRGYMRDDTEMATVIREPVDRLISYYFYARKTELMGQTSVDANRMELVEFAESYSLGRSLREYFGESVDAMKKAYAVIGDQNDLQAFADSVRDRFDLPARYTHRTVNRNRSRGEVSPAEVVKLTEITADDRRFYNAIGVQL